MLSFFLLDPWETVVVRYAAGFTTHQEAEVTLACSIRAGPGSPGLLWWLGDKESACQCRRLGFNPYARKIPWRGNGNALQYSCLGNSMDRGAGRAAVHGVARSSIWQRLDNKNKGIPSDQSHSWICQRIQGSSTWDNTICWLFCPRQNTDFMFL